MESLGYIPISTLLFSPNYSDLSYWYIKYGTFQKRNGKDIENLKAKAMQTQNYDKVDEFFQYQDYLEKSYFSQLVKYLKNTSQVKEKFSNETWVQDFCKGVVSKDYPFADEKYDDLSDENMSKTFTRTQDLGVWTGKYSEIPKYQNITEEWKVSEYYTTAEDDPIFGYIKFNEKCNYKPGLANSLSILEHPLMLQIYQGLIHLTSLAYLKSKETEKVESIRNSVEKKISILKEQLETNPSYFGTSKDLEFTKSTLNFFNGWF